MSASEPNCPHGGGDELGDGWHTWRRGCPPDHEDTGTADAADLAMTACQAVPDAKVWGLRVSEQLYDNARSITGVLAAGHLLDQRQVGELIVQFLIARHADLDTYIAQKVGPARLRSRLFAPPSSKPGSTDLP